MGWVKPSCGSQEVEYYISTVSSPNPDSPMLKDVRLSPNSRYAHDRPPVCHVARSVSRGRRRCTTSLNQRPSPASLMPHRPSLHGQPFSTHIQLQPWAPQPLLVPPGEGPNLLFRLLFPGCRVALIAPVLCRPGFCAQPTLAPTLTLMSSEADALPALASRGVRSRYPINGLS